MALAGIGDASAIIAVADLGLRLAQTLVTIIGDFRDAAININRLRDEIHLTSICLQQLGDLAKQNKLIAGRGVLEATNLRERTRAVIWEIRTVIKKGDDPLQPEDISGDEIDVTYFAAWKWALWTKKHLEGPRQELDRLKDSITLSFVSHMALTASNDRERIIYVAQIPGIRRNCAWAEEQYRNDEQPPDPPQEVLGAGPEEWQKFIEWRRNSDVSEAPSLPAAGTTNGQLVTATDTSSKQETRYQAWSLEPLVGRLPMNAAVTQQSPDELSSIHARLKPWYKQQLDELLQDQDIGYEWSTSSLRLVHKSFFRRIENPPALRVVLKGETRRLPDVHQRMEQPQGISPSVQQRWNQPQTILLEPNAEATTYTEAISIEKHTKTDEELIQEQLALYGTTVVVDAERE